MFHAVLTGVDETEYLMKIKDFVKKNCDFGASKTKFCVDLTASHIKTLDYKIGPQLIFLLNFNYKLKLVTSNGKSTRYDDTIVAVTYKTFGKIVSENKFKPNCTVQIGLRRGLNM